MRQGLEVFSVLAKSVLVCAVVECCCSVANVAVAGQLGLLVGCSVVAGLSLEFAVLPLCVVHSGSYC